MSPEQKEQLSKELEAYMQKALINGASSLHLVFMDFMVSKIEEKDSAIYASERFRAQDAMSHINEANELRAKLQQSEAKLEAARKIEFERGAEEQRQILWKMFEKAGGTLSAFHTENYLDKPIFKSLDK
jgi:hypothetical protein